MMTITGSNTKTLLDKNKVWCLSVSLLRNIAGGSSAALGWAKTGTKPESIRPTWRTTFVFNGQTFTSHTLYNSNPVRLTTVDSPEETSINVSPPDHRSCGRVAPLPAEEDINRQGISICSLPVVQQPGRAALAVEAVSLLCSKSLYHSIRGACGGGNKEWKGENILPRSTESIKYKLLVVTQWQGESDLTGLNSNVPWLQRSNWACQQESTRVKRWILAQLQTAPVPIMF